MLRDRDDLIQFGAKSLHPFRRTMLKFSMETEVIPSSLFLQNIQCSERNEPRLGGGHADIFYGTIPGKAVALKRLRLGQGANPGRYFKVNNQS